jgi:hypothetical protein
MSQDCIATNTSDKPVDTSRAGAGVQASSTLESVDRTPSMSMGHAGDSPVSVSVPVVDPVDAVPVHSRAAEIST